jgi:hypothetical protein
VPKGDGVKLYKALEAAQEATSLKTLDILEKKTLWEHSTNGQRFPPVIDGPSNQNSRNTKIVAKLIHTIYPRKKCAKITYNADS